MGEGRRRNLQVATKNEKGTLCFPIEAFGSDPAADPVFQLIDDRPAQNPRGIFRGKLLKLGQLRGQSRRYVRP